MRVVRRGFTRQLRKKLHRVLSELDDQILVHRQWDVIEVEREGSGGTKLMQIEERLRNIPGVAQINCAEKHPLPSMSDMLELTKAVYCEVLKGKTFAVRCKRSGDHSFSSVGIERFVGGGLNEECSTGGVKLKHQEVTVNLEIRSEFFYIVKTKIQGLGGLLINLYLSFFWCSCILARFLLTSTEGGETFNLNREHCHCGR